MAAKNEALRKLYDKIKGGNNAEFISVSKFYLLDFLTVNTDLLETLNTQQLAKGEYADGTSIQDGYSDMWQRERVINGKQVAFVDLNYSGDFYESIEATPSLSTILFRSTDPKYKGIRLTKPNKLNRGLGGVLGLNQVNATFIAFQGANVVRNNLIEYFSK